MTATTFRGCFVERAAQKIVFPKQADAVIGREGEMKRGRAGGMLFRLPWEQALLNFLYLGNQHNTYYASRDDMNYSALKVLISEADPLSAVDIIGEHRYKIPRPKNAVGVYAVLLAIERNPDIAKRLREAFGKIIKNGSDLLYFVKIYKSLGGSWGRGMRSTIEKFYKHLHDIGLLEYTVTKYRSRWGGWSQRDVLRLAHPRPLADYADVFKWVVSGEFSDSLSNTAIEAYMDIVSGADPLGVVDKYLQLDNRAIIMWELFPTDVLRSKELWLKLLDGGVVGGRALLRNMRRFAQIGLLDTQRGANVVAEAIRDTTKTTSPMLILLAALALQYEDAAFKPMVLRQLDHAFGRSFANGVGPQFTNTDKPLAIIVDKSASMNYCNGCLANPMVLAHALAGVLARSWSCNTVDLYVDTSVQTANFAGVAPSALSLVRADGGGTHLDKAIGYLINKKIEPAAVVMISDMETYGSRHVFQLVDELRGQTNMGFFAINVVGGENTIADTANQNDINMAGFDPSMLDVIAAKINGEF